MLVTLEPFFLFSSYFPYSYTRCIRLNLMNESDCYKIIYDLEMSDLSVLECEHDDDYDFIIGSEIL